MKKNKDLHKIRRNKISFLLRKEKENFIMMSLTNENNQGIFRGALETSPITTDLILQCYQTTCTCINNKLKGTDLYLFLM